MKTEDWNDLTFRFDEEETELAPSTRETFQIKRKLFLDYQTLILTRSRKKQKSSDESLGNFPFLPRADNSIHPAQSTNCMSSLDMVLFQNFCL